MRADDEEHADIFETEEELELLLEGPKEAARKVRNARVNHIRRHLEDLQEQRRFQKMFEDLD